MKKLKNYKKTLDILVKKLTKQNTIDADTNYKVLKKLFDQTYQKEIFDLSNIEQDKLNDYRVELFTKLTLVSGSLSFLAIQILAANNIMNKNNYKRKDKYLAKKCGIAINHLRAPKTIVSATKCDDGYKLNGTLTWASGYKIFDTLLIGFHCDGYELEAMAPFKKAKGFHIGSPDDTFVGYGLNTVNIELNNFFVKDKNIVSSNKIGNYTKAKSASKTVHYCIYALGNSVIQDIEDKKFKKDAKAKLNSLKNKILSSDDIDQLDSLRIELFILVQEIITTAMILNGGKSILLSEVYQRYYRELIMFNSNGLNQTLKDIFKNKFLNKVH